MFDSLFQNTLFACITCLLTTVCLCSDFKSHEMLPDLRGKDASLEGSCLCTQLTGF